MFDLMFDMMFDVTWRDVVLCCTSETEVDRYGYAHMRAHAHTCTHVHTHACTCADLRETAEVYRHVEELDCDVVMPLLRAQPCRVEHTHRLLAPLDVVCRRGPCLEPELTAVAIRKRNGLHYAHLLCYAVVCYTVA